MYDFFDAGLYVTGRIAVIQFFLREFLGSNRKYEGLRPSRTNDMRLDLAGCSTSMGVMVQEAFPDGGDVAPDEIAQFFALTNLSFEDTFNCAAYLHIGVHPLLPSRYPCLQEVPTRLTLGDGRSFGLLSVLLHHGNHFAMAFHVPDESSPHQFVWHDAIRRPTCHFVTSITEFADWVIVELWYIPTTGQ